MLSFRFPVHYMLAAHKARIIDHMSTADFLVIGAGIAGASAGYALAAHGRVVVVDQETVAGYHTTGRSAAFFAETYGNEAVRCLTSAAKFFFQSPPEGFTATPLVKPRGALFIAQDVQLPSLERLYADKRRALPSVERVDGAFIRRHMPLVRDAYTAGGVWDPECQDIDVHALHQGFLKHLKRHGGTLRLGAGVAALSRHGPDWRALLEDGSSITAPVVINAAGAWADKIAVLAGLAPMGLTPKRRTIITFPAPPGLDHDRWPLTLDVDDLFYLKPEAGRVLASPGDATPMPPQDVQPDEMDVALAAHRLEAAFRFQVSRIERKWAGLRTFALDDSPVVGADPADPGFFWFAGQGGFGMQTAPAMAALLEGLVTKGVVPPALQGFGVTAAALSPARFAAASSGDSASSRQFGKTAP